MTYGLCVFGDAGDNCSTNAQAWCIEPLECQELGQTPNWLGACVAPPTCEDVDGPSCDDALACTVDACVDGVCDNTSLAPETCLIAGACYSDGEASMENACKLCASELDPNAWSNAPDSDLCQNGEPVSEPVDSDVVEDVDNGDVFDGDVDDAGPEEDLLPAEEDVPPAAEDVPPAEEDVPPSDDDVPPAN